MTQITVKVIGNQQSVQKFIAVTRKVFGVAVSTSLKQNDGNSDVHCFLALDPDSAKVEA